MPLLQAGARLAHREKWATELAKQLEKLPSQVRAFAQNTESDQALLDALLACLGEGDANAGGVPADPLAGGLFAAEEREEAAPRVEVLNFPRLNPPKVEVSKVGPPKG